MSTYQVPIIRRFILVSLFVLPWMTRVVGAFCPLSFPSLKSRQNDRNQCISTTCQRVIPGIDMVMMDAAIAVVSAAAGAATQLPRIQQLEKDLDAARSAITQVRWME